MIRQFRNHKAEIPRISDWGVLNRVGVDGVGGNFPFSVVLRFFAFLRSYSIFFFFLRFSLILMDNGRQPIYWQDGEFYADLVCSGPVQNLPIQSLLKRHLNQTLESW